MAAGYLYYSTEPKDCPLNYFELRQYNESYSEKNSTCIKIVNSTLSKNIGTIYYNAEYCHEFNISVYFGTTWSNTAFN